MENIAGLRGKNPEGTVSFGYKKTNEEGELINDYVLNLDDKLQNEAFGLPPIFGDTHFSLQYDQGNTL